MLNALKRRIQMMIATGLLKVIDDSKPLQQLIVSLRAGEKSSELENAQTYGMTAHAPPGSEPIVLYPNGDRDYGVVIAVADRKFRLKGLAQGEVALYDDLGQKVHLTRAGIFIKSDNAVVTDTPDAFFTGNVFITGECTINGIPFTPHTHPESIGSETSVPSRP